MKKIFIGIICFVLLISCVFVFSSCKDDENENTNDTLTIEEIAERLNYLDSQGKIDLERTDSDDAEGWTYEINEELERYNEELLQGDVRTVYYTDDETYIIEFESIVDAKKAMSPLAYWGNEWRYSEWQIIREGKIVLFGEKTTISLILNTQQGSSSNQGSQCEYEEKSIVWSWNGYSAATATANCKCGDVTHTKQLTASISTRTQSAIH